MTTLLPAPATLAVPGAPLAEPTLSTRRQLELMRTLQRLAKTRHEEELRIAEADTTGLKAARKQRDKTVKQARLEHEQELATAVDLDARQRETDHDDYERVTNALRWEYQKLRTEIEAARKKIKQAAQKKLDEGIWQIRSIYDAQKEQPRERLEEVNRRFAELRKHLDETRQAADEVLTDRWVSVAPTDIDPAAAGEADPAREPTDPSVDQGIESVAADSESARVAAQHLYDGWLSRMFDPGNLLGIELTAFALTMPAVWWLFRTEPLERSLGYGAGAGAAVMAALFALLWFAVKPLARKQTDERYQETAVLLRRAYGEINDSQSLARTRSENHARLLIERRDADLAAIQEQVTRELKAAKAKNDAERARIDEEYPRRLTESRESHEAEVERLDREHTAKVAALLEEREITIRDAEQQCAAEEDRLEQQRTEDYQAMRNAWLDGTAAISSEFAAQREFCEQAFPNWSSADYLAWEKPEDPLLAVPFGEARLDLAAIKHGLSENPDLRPAETQITLPTMVTLTEQPHLLINAEGPARQRAVELLQAMTLRYFTGQPPGKVRLTLLDPVGLGEGLSPFMHLADYEEDLIADRIWSESRDIDAQLQRLTTHMETVIQKYLRSEYDSIHEYNAQAGEVAEPFQVVVVSGFPTNFSDSAARRLVSIATGGPRCGVYVLGVIDSKQRMPTDFNMEDLTSQAVNLSWDDQQQRFVWRYPAFERLPITTAKPPQPERMVEVVRQAGAAAKDAVRVEVPFEVVAPHDGYWRESCSHELRVPVGRAGANRLQDVRLGKGTSQHLLVAGKTGSGKSTFLHALITSAALHFSPDEVEFYLVDFKKGVEFKSYANNRLPHARVVAIESEREFGLSVLERLDRELTRRGELYRDSGAQNLADFRAGHPDTPMPRILLVIDEFQELFVEDDRLAQEASLLMDRLVRQGRAFGVHVVLGTQTLAGAYSIARSTLGQIAVRIALECSESDAHLILADERNQAARFLSRPGEAIYNDQNGLASANEPFQVVWLPDAERAERLRVLNEHREAVEEPAGEMIVFEGNAPADPLNNRDLVALVDRRKSGEPAPEAAQPEVTQPATTYQLPPAAYLGAAVAIKPPTQAELGRHAGANLLVVGPQEEGALGVLTTAVASLWASAPGARFVVLDGSRPGDISLGVWPRVADSLADSDQGPVEVLTPQTAAAGVADLAVEVARREEQPESADPPVYLVVWSGGRFRDLRKSEDDFSFSMSDDKPKSADKHLTEILKNGPSVGVHALIWCDGYNQVARMFDRVTMREFGLRVAFQMSAADSSNLLDSPAASTLRQHRALFYTDETGESEKFRPYGPPSDAWLNSLATGSARQGVE
ncbi:FtsK/SpoIIIE domain-containing protein [Posidoniimonas polymericola]|uniref:FtsK/SpoIIIE domain-containing protein n=1 Tax=Posidoniimonas polymericola TaxID=2528002 RepID=UPI0011B3C96D|nr:FtsK/SpoIIIE domain-containing protein [Posidoniimonas polymericola]